MSGNQLGKWQFKSCSKNIEFFEFIISTSPFKIGRGDDCDLRLNNDIISRFHAEISITNDQISIRDCGSANGTFVNFHRITSDQRLNPGDLVHIANTGFQVHYIADALADYENRTINVPAYVEKIDNLITSKSVTPHFQPIVQLQDKSVIGHELLGRVQYDGLPRNIEQLFKIAEHLDRDVDLSVLFRDTGITQYSQEKVNGTLFFNTVPNELNIVELTNSLTTLRKMAPEVQLAMEIHETAFTTVSTISEISSILKDLEIKMVYDDFGVGQSRLAEMINTSPDIIKFDICLIHNIHLQPEKNRKTLTSLVEMTKELNVIALAEGVELTEEAEMCKHIGFDLAQGYFFGKPSNDLKAFTNQILV